MSSNSSGRPVPAFITANFRSEILGKIRVNLNYHLHTTKVTNSEQTRRRHAHMHTVTRKQPGIDLETAKDLEENFTWVPPLVGRAADSEDLAGPETISLCGIDSLFAEF
ncbi:hypothetical protein J3R83DRAFT_3057 [Lanmaoa asiatica]|nr:hypothetical protein J3R83DRAFT_3057 [Lanmaoa asiatica]